MKIKEKLKKLTQPPEEATMNKLAIRAFIGARVGDLEASIERMEKIAKLGSHSPEEKP